jgi:hypothetical protein
MKVLKGIAVIMACLLAGFVITLLIIYFLPIHCVDLNAVFSSQPLAWTCASGFPFCVVANQAVAPGELGSIVHNSLFGFILDTVIWAGLIYFCHWLFFAKNRVKAKPKPS